ncbi:MAG: sugar ABC transporter substrate-binding protein, partial [Gammaproteobacteria bacterium]|nr:sugar ABC transporter substrate-binding protein [Gammaproteobacteria bacterium]
AGFEQGCLGTMIALRHLRKQPVAAEVVFPAIMIHKDNYQRFDVPAEQRSCPSYEELTKK